MKAPPSLLVLCLAILALVLISILAVHVEPAQGLRLLSTPPSPDPHRGPGARNNG
ncbi:hypothetical protein BS78_08G052900 [Paspalum vaginatum]|nr:hypothetical protein BS78_08G052900 [Paspalum vaginatum]